MSRRVIARMNAGSAVAAFGLFVLALLWLGVAWDLGCDRERVLRQAEADTANLARAFEGHIQRTIAGPDQTMLYLAGDYQQLSEFYGSFDVGAQGAIRLIGRNGIVRAASDDTVGRIVLSPAEIDQFFADNVGSQRGAGSLDGVSRIASFRALAGKNLVVWVGRSQDEVLAAHMNTQRIYVSVAAAVTVVLGVALVMLFRLVRRQEVFARALTVKKAELLASRARLRRYVADLERIAEIAAHDMQEPLRRVVAYAQLLSSHADSALDAESRDYVAHVVAGAQRMRKLVQDLEAFVAVDQMPQAETVIPAGAAMAAAAERLGEDVRRARASLVIGTLPAVAAEERSLTEIFVQLVDNALRYRSPDRPAQIHVMARHDGPLAVFSVRDNGMGIEDRHLPRLFEIFHRLQGIDGRPGTGMGLAIVRRMVERLGGRVWVDSQLGSGSTFWFTLPLEVPNPLSLDQEAQAA